MSTYATAFAKQLKTGLRWSNLAIAQTRLTLLTFRLALRDTESTTEALQRIHTRRSARKR